jgi:hypothetical protein
MKHLKMLGLAVVAAAAFMAVIGAGTASATELCTTATTPCSGTMYQPGTRIDAMLETGTNAVLTTSITTVTCTASTVNGETTSTGGATTTAVTGKISGLTFTGCTRTGGEACTVTSVALGNVSVTGGAASTTAKFNFNLTSKTSAHVVCGFFINCTFYTESATLAGQNQTTGMPTIKAENIVLKKEPEGICPETATWTAAYEVTEPTPLYVV